MSEPIYLNNTSSNPYFLEDAEALPVFGESVAAISLTAAVTSVNRKTGDVVLRTEDLENNSGYITKDVDDLTNYTKTDDMGEIIGDVITTHNEDEEAHPDIRQDIEEVDERLQGEIDDIKNSPDVVDIVATYAALQEYDTSALTDKDIIRVLADETHNGESSYYRWSTSTELWTFVGATGPYYTKNQADVLLDTKADKSTTYTKTEVDTALNAKQDNLTAGTDINITNNVVSATNRGLAKVLTTDDYNWNSSTNTGTEPYNCVAIWKLDPGVYYAQPNVISFKINADSTAENGGGTFEVMQRGADGTNPQLATVFYSLGTNPDLMSTTVILDNDTTYGQPASILRTSNVIDALSSTSTKFPLSAKQGKVLDEKITNNVGKARVLTTADYNYHSTGSVDNGVALWLLEPGLYYQPKTLTVYISRTDAYQAISYGTTWLLSEVSNEYHSLLRWDWNAWVGSNLGGSGVTCGMCYELSNDGTMQPGSPTFLLTENAITHQGNGLRIEIGNDASVQADNGVAIGSQAHSTSNESVAIGYKSYARQYSVSIGSQTGPTAASNVQHQVNLGYKAGLDSNANGSVSLGAFSKATHAGEVNIGTPLSTSSGYLSSEYRLLTGLYNPQSDHDAANKIYVDTAIAQASNTINSTDWSNLWQ